MAGAEKRADEKGPEAPEIRIVGRFEMHHAIASGGFATVHLGRTRGAGGFAKLVAIKRLHSQFATNDEVRTMFLDEARVVARVRHTNVVPTLDFIEEDGELFMVMEYVEGVTLGYLSHRLQTQQRKMPWKIALRIMTGALEGLHAAHEATDEHGAAMDIIHRDVSPDNILVGLDGHARLLDFGVARALKRYHSTRDGEVKGKMFYMAPEQVTGKPLDRRTDIFSASVVMWQCLTGERLFDGDHLGELVMKVTQQDIAPPSTINKSVPPEVDAVVLRGLARDPDDRWADADQMAEAIQEVTRIATPSAVAKWLKAQAKQRLEKRARLVSMVELGAEGSHASEGQEYYRAATSVVVSLTDKEDQTDLIPIDELQAQADAGKDGPTQVLPTPAPSSPGVPPPPRSSSGGMVPDGDSPKVQLAAHTLKTKLPVPPAAGSDPGLGLAPAAVGSSPGASGPISAPVLAPPGPAPGAAPALLQELSLASGQVVEDRASGRKTAMVGVAVGAVALVGLGAAFLLVGNSSAPSSVAPDATAGRVVESQPTPVEASALPEPAASPEAVASAPAPQPVADAPDQEAPETSPPPAPVAPAAAKPPSGTWPNSKPWPPKPNSSPRPATAPKPAPKPKPKDSLFQRE